MTGAESPPAAALRVLGVTNMFPTPEDPTYGAFVASQMESIAATGVSVMMRFIDGRRSNRAYLQGIWEVHSLVTGGRFDLVHAHYGLSGFVGSFQPLPLVVSFCGDDLFGTPTRAGRRTLKSRLARRLSQLAAMRANEIICKSQGMVAALPRPRDRSRAHIIPNGVDISRFRPGNRAVARQRLGIGIEERLIIFPHSRREMAQKRFDLAEAAIAELKHRGVHGRLWVINGVSPERMPDHYWAADCLLMTSDQEGSPNVVKEALCCNLPVVSVDVGDVRHWLSLAGGCRIVERQPAAIADGLCEVLRDSFPRVDGSKIRLELDAAVVAARVVGVYEAAMRARSVVTAVRPNAGSGRRDYRGEMQ